MNDPALSEFCVFLDSIDPQSLHEPAPWTAYLIAGR